MNLLDLVLLLKNIKYKRTSPKTILMNSTPHNHNHHSFTFFISIDFVETYVYLMCGNLCVPNIFQAAIETISVLFVFVGLRRKPKRQGKADKFLTTKTSNE